MMPAPLRCQVQQLSTQLQEAIKLTRGMIDERWAQLKEKEEQKYVVGAECEAKYEREGWYTCKIEEVIPPADEDDEKRWMVSFIGFPLHPLQVCPGAPTVSAAATFETTSAQRAANADHKPPPPPPQRAPTPRL